ncbi:MAG TPA: hypothetical protein DHV93_03935 [Holophagaceae bacterium]|nr:hypothetical protein [Holophagaceae bacterium]
MPRPRRGPPGGAGPRPSVREGAGGSPLRPPPSTTADRNRRPQNSHRGGPPPAPGSRSPQPIPKVPWSPPPHGTKEGGRWPPSLMLDRSTTSSCPWGRPSWRPWAWQPWRPSRP